jgi:5-deoxy-glucuronate isomerase
MTLHRPYGSSSRADGVEVSVTPESAGWAYAGLQVLRLSPGETYQLATGGEEIFVLPLSGAVEIVVRATGGSDEVEAEFRLVGRDSVFTRVTDFAYVGRDSEVVLTSVAGAELALPSARCEQRRAPRYGPAEQVPVGVRGAGQATRQVTDFGTPGVWDHAEKLICCELITPAGNWSSYPPHKHDITDACPVANEEIYYYRIADADGVTPSRTGYGLHVTTTGPEHLAAGLEALDAELIVRDGDVVLVPYGYHGPCAAAPGYAMYYLNVLAGPGEARSMAFCDHPDHAWIRDSWDGAARDPRCPVTSAQGRVAH